MKTLFVLASVIVVLFLAAPNKVEAQKRKAAAKPSSIDFVRRLDANRRLIENPKIKARLQQLLGRERFVFMFRRWNLGTPIKITNDALVETGCMSHFCDSTNFIIVIDITNNKFYVGIRDNDRIKIYSEKDSFPSLQIQRRIQHWKDYGSDSGEDDK